MEAITDLFQHLSYLIETLLALIAVCGVIVLYKGYRISGMLLGFGGALHFVGYCLLVFGAEISELRSFLISLMYPGNLLWAMGLLSLALTLKRPQADA